jgi:signal transduction histidine kinase
MREADDRFVFIGKMRMANDLPLILLSRRYNLLSGEFGGIVVAAIDPKYFVNFYASVAFGQQKYMNLTLSDGTSLSNGPVANTLNDTLVQSIINAKRSREQKDTQLFTTSVNNTIKITASRQLQNVPLGVHVVLDEADVLASWRQSRAKDIGFLALFTVFGSVLSFFAIAMARQILRAEESEEAAILASQAKSEFLANMSHELRTPLNAIIGFSEMMNSGYFGPLTPKQRERINDINLCGSHLLQLISDILEFSKGDAGKLELVEEKVELSEIVNECERMMDGRMRMKGIQFSSAIEVGLPALWGDKRKLRQIMLNLLSNAVKFTPEGGQIKVLCVMDAQGQLNMAVSDTGIGIPEEEIPLALSVFGQVHRGRSHDGTGLGLPLCKMYAELHGGKLILTSAVGEGTSVRILFPPQRVLVNKHAES